MCPRTPAIVVMLTLAATLTIPSAGLAGESADAEAAGRADSEKRMLALNEAGFAAFAEGDFVEAAQKFEEAHTHVADPILRKNAAIAWFKAGRCAEASEAATFFLLADEMTVKDRIEARSVLGHCRLEEAEEAIEAGEFDRAREIVERIALLQTDERVEDRLAATRMKLVETGEASPASQPQVNNTGWMLVGTGAAILAGTAGYHIASDAGDDTASWLVPTLYAVGGVTSGTGVYLVVSEGGDSQETAKPAAQKAPAPAVQVGMSLRF